MATKAETFTESMAYFRAISLAFGQFARLVRTEQYLILNPPPSNEPTWQEILTQALAENLAEMEAENSPPPSCNPEGAEGDEPHGMGASSLEYKA